MRLYLVAVCVLITVVVTAAVDAAELETRSLLNGKIQMLIPTHFEPMDEDLLRTKYPSERRPTTVLTNERGTFNVTMNHLADALSTQQLTDAHQAFDEMFRNVYPSATWYRSEVTSINGRDCFVLELLTPAVDAEIHNIIVVTPLENRVLIVSVNLTKELTDQLLSTARQMVDSITVKK